MAELRRYFAARSAQELGRLKSGINYIESQLTNQLQISETQKIFALIYRYRSTNKYPLIESHPGIGTTSIIFASELGGRIVRLQIIEFSDNLKTILNNNLLLYGVRTNVSEINFEDYFPSVVPNYRGGVAIFYPTIAFRGKLPSLTQGVGKDWLNEAIFIGPSSRTPLVSILDILEKVGNTLQLSLFVLPLDFPVLPSLPDTQVETSIINDFKVYVVFTQVGRNLATSLPELGGSRFATNDIALQQILRRVSGILNDFNATLKKNGMAEIDVSGYLKPEYHKIWERAFTSAELQPENIKNYEALEHFGDRMLKGAWANLMITTHPGITANELNLSGDKHMSKRYQPILAKQMRLSDVAIYPDGINVTKLREDLFESFIGALGMVANYEEGNGASLIRTYHFLVHLFPKVPDLSEFQPVQTQVKEILEALWFEVEFIVVSETAGVVQYVLKIPQSFQEFLQVEGKPIENRLLAKVEATGKVAGKDRLYRDGLNTLLSRGITKEQTDRWAQEYRIKIADLKEYISAVDNKMKLRKVLHLYYHFGAISATTREFVLWEVLMPPEKVSKKTGKKKGLGQSSNLRRKALSVVAEVREGRVNFTKEQLIMELISRYLQLPAQ